MKIILAHPSPSTMIGPATQSAIERLGFSVHPQPFTRDDVADIRSQVNALRKEFGPHIADAYDLESIANRIEGML